jgi:UDP-glucose 4-epimerase
MTRTLLTGGAGFIGSHLAEALLARGDDVLVVDDLSTGKRDNIAALVDDGSVKFAQADIADPDALAAAVDEFAPERILHIAGQADARKAIADPNHDARVNVIGTVNVLEAARRHGASLVFTSTGGVSYGEGEGRRLPFQETDDTRPETAYGVSKLAAEKYVAFYRLLHGVPAVSLRLGNVYGPRQDPHGEAGVVAIFCGRLLAGEPPLVFGDGEQTRDYVFVDDIVAGILAAERGVLAGAASRDVYNIGTGTETTVLQIAEGLSRASGIDAEPEFRPHRQGEIQRVAIDPAAAGNDLGWSAEADLDEALATTFAWARENLAP